MLTPIETAILNLNDALAQFSAAIQLMPQLQTTGPITKPFPKITHPDRTPIDAIKNTVAQHYGISVTDLLSTRKCAGVVWPRMIAMWISKKLNPDWSYLFIAGIFARKDAGSGQYALKAVNARRDTEPKFRAETDALLSRLSPCGAPVPSRAIGGAPAPSRAIGGAPAPSRAFGGAPAPSRAFGGAPAPSRVSVGSPSEH
jgi:hypothetical protein